MVVVLGLGIAIVLVPLALLIPLLIKAAQASDPTEHSLLWLWVSMTVIELGLAAFIIWGMFRTAFGLWQEPMYPK